MTPAWGDVWWCDTTVAGRRPCVVLNLDTPRVLPLEAFSERVGSLSFDRMQQVCHALAAAVDCR